MGSEPRMDVRTVDGALSTAAVGRLMSMLFILSGVVTALYPLLPTAPGFRSAAVMAVGAFSVAVGATYWRMPWGRWHRRTSLLAGVPLAHVLIALHNYFGGVDPYRYCLFFMVVYVWLGLSQRRWTSLRVVPLTVLAYLAPLLISHRPAVALVSVVYALPVFVLVGESIAWVTMHLQRAQRSLAHQAFHDPLTGLANRALFTDRVEHATELHRRDLRPVTLLFLDLDDFKSVNDTFGHAGGDSLLRAVAERLRAALRPSDTLARLGGDEFAVLLESLLDDPVAVGHRVLAALETPFAVSNRSVRITSSIGIVTAGASAVPIDAATLLRRADDAMYAAKAAGKQTLRVYADGDTAGVPADSRGLTA